MLTGVIGRKGSSEAGTETKSPKSVDAEAGVGKASESGSTEGVAGIGINGGMDLSEGIV